MTERQNGGMSERRKGRGVTETSAVPSFTRSVILILCLLGPTQAAAQDTALVRERSDSVTIRFVDADLRAVVQALGRYLTKPLMVAGIPGTKVSLETPGPMPRGAVRAMLQGLIESQALVFAEESAFIRIGPAETSAVPSSRRSAGDPGDLQLSIIRLKHARAADVAATVNLLFDGGGEFSGRGLGEGTLSDELRRMDHPSDRPPVRPSDHPSSSALSGPVTLVPDALTNTLLVRASAVDFEVLRSAVALIDVRPLQVMIEVLIVEARRSRDFSLGTSIFVPQQGIKGDVDGSIGGETRGSGVGDLVLRLLNLGKADIDATLSASESRGNVKIVSRPVLLASNGVEASFLVGSQRPFVQVSRLLPTDNNNQDRVVQYRDVGTRLRVLPTINQDGYVSLLIQQEINAATNEVAFDAPVISTREATTQVLVRDGQTIMLGGLTDEQRDRSRSGVPLLSGLPIIGGLFGASSRNDSETELYLFITPRILRTDEDADAYTAPRLPKGESR